LKADKTKQNAEYVPTINTWASIIKNKVDVEIDEKDQVEEAIKTKQNAEYTQTATTCVPILKNKTPNKFAKVSLSGTGLRSLTWSSSTLETPPSQPSSTLRTSTNVCRRLRRCPFLKEFFGPNQFGLLIFWF
jgi:hypothetical protein